MTKTIVVFIGACLCIFFSIASVAQEGKPSQFPTELKPVLDSQVKRFVDAQADGRWDDVSALLGNNRYGYFGPSVSFTKSHKACLVSEMQKFPMVGFDYSIDETGPYSSERLSVPRDERWWRLAGEGTFRKGTETIKQRTWLAAYKYHGAWFFSPPNIDGADAFRDRQKDATRDTADQVDLLIGPDSPLQIVELKVLDDPNNFGAREIYFRLYNRTSGSAIRYGFKISDENKNGSITFATGAEKDVIPPNATSREFHETYQLFLYWCEGTPRIRIEIDDVSLNDGTEWKRSDSPPPKKVER